MNFEEKIKQIQDKIKNSKAPVMFFDSDTDGATSYLQLKKAFPKIKGYPFAKDLDKQKELIENLKKKTDLIMIFDVPYLYEDFLKQISCEVIWVDHHPGNSTELIQKYNIIHFNPLNFNENDNRAVSYLSYLISGEKEELLSLAVLGSVSDFFLLNIIKDLYEKNKRDFNTLFPKLDEKSRKLLFNFLEKYSFDNQKAREKREYWIRYLIYEAGLIKFKTFFDFLFKFKDDEDILNAFHYIEKKSIFDLCAEINARKGKIFENYSQLLDEYNLILKDAKKVKPKNNLYFFTYDSDMSFTKTLAEEIRYIYKSVPVVAICFKKADKPYYHCSFRGVNYVVNSLVERALNGLDGMGGGHPYAAGARVHENDFLKFKKRIFKQLSSTTE